MRFQIHISSRMKCFPRRVAFVPRNRDCKDTTICGARHFSAWAHKFPRFLGAHFVLVENLYALVCLDAEMPLASNEVKCHCLIGSHPSDLNIQTALNHIIGTWHSLTIANTVTLNSIQYANLLFFIVNFRGPILKKNYSDAMLSYHELQFFLNLMNTPAQKCSIVY